MAIAASLASAGLIYPETMEVISTKNDVLTMQTSTGHIYEKEDADGWNVGDLASVLMFSNGTPKVYDDVILAAKYSGYTKNNFPNN